MSIRVFAAAAAAATLALAAPAGAQSRPRPDDPAVKTPPPASASAFAGYRPFREEEMAPWREVNDEVGRLGGHSGHMTGHVKEMEDAQPAAPQPSSAPSAAQPVRRSDAPGGPKHGH
jgi:hypothetical protein